jgi:NTE family protein
MPKVENAMNARTQSDELDVLVLQGGGALGAYQAGAFEELYASGRRTDWVAGVSIGAINAALIAGNPPDRRGQQLRAFWDRVSPTTSAFAQLHNFLPRSIFNDFSANAVMLQGVPGFFKPRFPPATVMLNNTTETASFYDTDPLRDTLLELVDFDYLNTGPVRFSTGAVNVETGNMTWFDNKRDMIGPEHIMASGALPPGFPAVKIDGQFYWDGGLVSNTPLQYVYDQRGEVDLCVFQVDLFNARGVVPQAVWDVGARVKDIRFSSRTRLNTDTICTGLMAHSSRRRLYDKLPVELRDDPDALALLDKGPDPKMTIAHLIYRHTRFEGHSKDYEFSRASMHEHWKAGAQDVATTLSHPEWQSRHDDDSTLVRVFDLTRQRP